jgi:uncharacterized protein
MEAIYIPGLLKLPEKTETIPVREFLGGFESLTPVKGEVAVTHQGNYLEVSARAETIVTLSCHRCLQQYNHRLRVDTSELLWLDESADRPDSGPLERETALEDLLETLSPQGHFYPDTWLYEQLCLAIPPRQLCDSQCQGIPIDDRDETSKTDQRWDALKALKQQLSG